jgi:hypothetical protein
MGLLQSVDDEFWHRLDAAQAASLLCALARLDALNCVGSLRVGEASALHELVHRAVGESASRNAILDAGFALALSHFSAVYGSDQPPFPQELSRLIETALQKSYAPSASGDHRQLLWREYSRQVLHRDWETADAPPSMSSSPNRAEPTDAFTADLLAELRSWRSAGVHLVEDITAEMPFPTPGIVALSIEQLGTAAEELLGRDFGDGAGVKRDAEPNAAKPHPSTHLLVVPLRSSDLR